MTDTWPGQAEYAAAQAVRHAQWRELRLQGLSYRQIAAQTGVTHSRVQQVLAPLEELITVSEAARRLGVSRRTIYIRLGAGSLCRRHVGGVNYVLWMKGGAGPP